MTTTSRRTTTWGGAAFAAGGLLQMLPLVTSSPEPALFLVAAVLLLAGGLVLALGAPGESGIAGSRGGAAALILCGGTSLIRMVTGPALVSGAPGEAVILLNLVVQLVLAAAAMIAAVSVVRAGVLHGVARWAFVALAAEAVLLDLLLFGPLAAPLLPVVTAVPVGFLRPLLLTAAGVVLVLHGRAVRSSISRTGASWRESTDVLEGSRR